MRNGNGRWSGVRVVLVTGSGKVRDGQVGNRPDYLALG